MDRHVMGFRKNSFYVMHHPRNMSVGLLKEAAQVRVSEFA
jgi:hypothetical protein